MTPRWRPGRETPELLFADYEGWACAVAIRSGIHWPGADRDDIRQEARIALWKAARTFGRRGSFPKFAALLIKRHLADCAFDRRKIEGVDRRVPRLPWSELPEGWEPVTPTLEEQAEKRAELRAIVAALETLTPIEREMFERRVVDGQSFREIAASGGPHFRRATNALQRATSKLLKAAA